MKLLGASAVLAAALSKTRGAPGSDPAGYPTSDEAKIKEVLREMTMEEKFLQTCIDGGCPESRSRWLQCNPFGEGSTAGGGDAWFVLKDIPRLGVRGMRMRDGPKGLTCQGGMPFGSPCPEDGTSPSFPSQVLRAATWNVELEEEIGRSIGDIGAQLDVHAALLPTINILPWLNWGRAQETYGEDPFFSGKMGAAVVRGVQRDRKVMATVKHFLANNIENTRWWVSAEIDERTLHEVYLRAWALVVRDAAPELVMTSYNRVQGKWPFADPKFIDILRNQLGFDGSIMTDWFASWEGITSGRILFDAGTSSPFFFSGPGFLKSNSLYAAGVDMEMPFCSKNRDAVAEAQMCSNAQDACETKQYVDAAVERILRSKARYGLFGQGVNHSRTTWHNEKFDRLTLQAAHEGMVLLKNEGGLLPKAPGIRVAVLGTPETLELGDHGSSAVKPSGRHVTVLQGLQEKYGAANVRAITEESAENTVFVTEADLVVLDLGLDHHFEGEFIPPATGGDRKYLTLHPWQSDLIIGVASLSQNVVVVITSGAAVIVEDFVDKVRGILWMGYPGPLGGQALADILAGEVNPSGRMPMVTPKRPEDYLPKGINLEPWAADRIDVAPTYPYSHGFKHMWDQGIEPRFPFGWGLSYTSFQHSGLSAELDLAGRQILVRIQVRNTGRQAGLETVQVYAQCEACRTKRLPLQLVAFQKVLLQPEEEKAIELPVELRDLAAYDAQASGSSPWYLESGKYVIFAGPAASADLLQRAAVDLAAAQTFRYPGRAEASSGRAEAEVRFRGCEAAACVPDSQLIKGAAVPSQLPLEPLMLIAFAVVYRVPVACISVVLAGLLVCCCCRRCSAKGNQVMDPKKES